MVGVMLGNPLEQEALHPGLLVAPDSPLSLPIQDVLSGLASIVT